MTAKSAGFYTLYRAKGIFLRGSERKLFAFKILTVIRAAQTRALILKA